MESLEPHHGESHDWKVLSEAGSATEISGLPSCSLGMFPIFSQCLCRPQGPREWAGQAVHEEWLCVTPSPILGEAARQRSWGMSES